MGPKPNHRDVTPILNGIRTWLRGKPHTNALRFADGLAARDQPPPEVPGGPYHKTSKVYYYARDARREVQPPFVITSAKQIASGSEAAAALKAATPNKVYIS